MAQQVIQAELRSDLGKNASRRLRRSGKVPAVVYGNNAENLSLTVDPKRVIEILMSETGRNSIIRLQVGDRSTDVMVREFQVDPLKSTLLHVDFVSIALDRIMEFEVPIEIVGTAKGVKEGGVLDTVMREIEVECLPRDVPNEIVVVVDAMEIGDSIRVSDLKIDTTKVTVLSDPDLVIATLEPPRAEEEPEVLEEAEEAVEPELIKKGKAEEEEEENE